MTSVQIAPAVVADRAAIRGLLERFALPTADLDNAPIRFWVARDGDIVVGTIGLERYGAAGLLRSLVVAPTVRLHGIGSSLVARLEREARASGVNILVVVTETARPFFIRHDYAPIDRAYLPDEIKQSAEFRDLCPASATCLSKSLAARQPKSTITRSDDIKAKGV